MNVGDVVVTMVKRGRRFLLVEGRIEAVARRRVQVRLFRTQLVWLKLSRVRCVRRA